MGHSQNDAKVLNKLAVPFCIKLRWCCQVSVLPRETTLSSYVSWSSHVHTHTHTHKHTHTPSQCITKSEVKWICLIRKSKNSFPWLLFTGIMWFLEEWDLNYYDLFSIGVQSCAFYILIWRFKKPFAVKKAISMITLWNTVHLKIEYI